MVNTVYQKFQPKELEDTQVMYLHAHGPGSSPHQRQGRPENGRHEGVEVQSPRHQCAGRQGPGRHPGAQAHAETYQMLKKALSTVPCIPLKPTRAGNWGR